jgi:hypothetical protein
MATPIHDILHPLYRDLLDFLVELMNETHTAATPDAFQRAVQAYCDALHPWVLPADIPLNPRASFSLFATYQANDGVDAFTVQLSPEGAAFFRAWLRRHGISGETARAGDPGWRP